MNEKLKKAIKLMNEVKAETGEDCGVECDERGNFSVIGIDRYNENDDFLYRTDK